MLFAVQLNTERRRRNIERMRATVRSRLWCFGRCMAAGCAAGSSSGKHYSCPFECPRHHTITLLSQVESMRSEYTRQHQEMMRQAMMRQAMMGQAMQQPIPLGPEEGLQATLGALSDTHELFLAAQVRGGEWDPGGSACKLLPLPTRQTAAVFLGT